MSFYVNKDGIPVEVTSRPGPPGEQGEPGPQGPPGPTPPVHYRHIQGQPSTTWLIQHNLGYNPGGIVVEDSGGTEHTGFGIDYIDPDNLILTFDYEFGGHADLS